MRVLNLSVHKKVISKNTDEDQYAPVEVVKNNGQPPKPAEMSTEDQKEFGENVEKFRFSSSVEKYIQNAAIEVSLRFYHEQNKKEQTC